MDSDNVASLLCVPLESMLHAPRLSSAPPGASAQPARRQRSRVRASEDEQGSASASQPAAKALWYAADALGSVLAAGKRSADGEQLASVTAEERRRWLTEDYAVDYFISGKGELKAYAADCEFADPFVSFRGTRRFLKNVSGLGSLFADVKLEVTSLVETDTALQSEWRFAASLPALPWNPRLFCRGGTTHTFDAASGLVVRHFERWDLEVGEGASFAVSWGLLCSCASQC